MNVCIVGIDGYLGWSLACYLAERGHTVSGIDAFYRRKWVDEVGGISITPIADMETRWDAHHRKWPDAFTDMLAIDISKDYKALLGFLNTQQPDAIVHLGEQPSAPFSMIDVDHAALTQQNNVIGTLRLLFAIKEACPDAHLLKLATMGEFGTPEIPICEGTFVNGSIIRYPDGREFALDGLMFPRNPGSYYHACYDDKTEVLTSNGWKLFEDVLPEDRISSVNPISLEMQYEEHSGVLCYDYSGEMYHLRQRSIDCLVTPNHRMVCGWANHGDPIWGIREAQDCISSPLTYPVAPNNWIGKDLESWTIPSCEFSDGWNTFTIEERDVPINNWLYFLGWYLSEGNADHNHKYRIALASDYNLEGAIAAFNGVGLDCGTSDKQAIKNNKQLNLHLRQFGYSHDKYIPQEIKDLPPERLELLLKSLMAGDGHIRNELADPIVGTYYTGSRQLANDVQEIALKCSLRATISNASRDGIVQEDEFRVNISLNNIAQCNLGKQRDSFEHYNGKVYCLTVPSGALMVRRNGKPIICGNSKVQDTYNVKKACDWWGLKSTSVMQGVVYGTQIDEFAGDGQLLTRFDADEVWGTIINRFVAQAIIDAPLTLYGKGHQRRGFLPLRDSMQCMTLLLENPPEAGEHRTVNQLEKVYDMTELAQKVQQVGRAFGLAAEIKNYSDPRIENEDHTYEVDNSTLFRLGYQPAGDMDAEISLMFDTLLPFRDRIMSMEPHLHPHTNWDGNHRDSEEIHPG